MALSGVPTLILLLHISFIYKDKPGSSLCVAVTPYPPDTRPCHPAALPGLGSSPKGLQREFPKGNASGIPCSF